MTLKTPILPPQKVEPIPPKKDIYIPLQKSEPSTELIKRLTIKDIERFEQFAEYLEGLSSKNKTITITDIKTILAQIFSPRDTAPDEINKFLQCKIKKVNNSDVIDIDVLQNFIKYFGHKDTSYENFFESQLWLNNISHTLCLPNTSIKDQLESLKQAGKYPYIIRWSGTKPLLVYTYLTDDATNFDNSYINHDDLSNTKSDFLVRIEDYIKTQQTKLKQKGGTPTTDPYTHKYLKYKSKYLSLKNIH